MLLWDFTIITFGAMALVSINGMLTVSIANAMRPVGEDYYSIAALAIGGAVGFIVTTGVLVLAKDDFQGDKRN